MHIWQVCGSDHVSYDNHCYLHKAACDSNTHISPVHGGFCRWVNHEILSLKLNHFCDSCTTKVFFAIVERQFGGNLSLVTPCYEFFASERILKSLQKTFKVYALNKCGSDIKQEAAREGFYNLTAARIYLLHCILWKRRTYFAIKGSLKEL